jgi:hypothetical protein
MLTCDPWKAKPRTAALDFDSTTPSVYSRCSLKAVSASSAMAPMSTASRIPLASAELICAASVLLPLMLPPLAAMPLRLRPAAVSCGRRAETCSTKAGRHSHMHYHVKPNLDIC